MGLLRVPGHAHLFRRQFFWALNKVWNYVDKDRIKEVGPDKACAEWLMKNGAFIKWAKESTFVESYNELQLETQKRFIEEIDATDSSIMALGFPYFVGCNSIKKVKFHKCFLIDNEALDKLSILKNSLQHLLIMECANVDDKGLVHLSKLVNLKYLLLCNLTSVKDMKKCLDDLKTALPDCKIAHNVFCAK